MISLEDYHWHFAVRLGGKDTAVSAVGKFFKDPIGSLVRESIQNSLDVAISDENPVKMAYRIGCVQLDKGSTLLELEKYIQGSLSMYKRGRAHDNLEKMATFLNSIKEKEMLYYMEVSDYNTKGMDYEPDNDATRFYSFAKCVGNSDKSNDTSGGSYGYGNAVFYNASNIRAILVSSMTEDGTCLFEGISSLSTSKIDGKKHEETGYYCLYEDEEPTYDSDFIPEEFQRKEPGSSVYILGIDPDVTLHASMFDRIRASVVENFWLSILGRKLVVEVDGVEINADNITEIAESIYGEGGPKHGEPYNPIPFIDAVKYANTDKKHILIEKTLPILGAVRLYIKKDKKAVDRILYMRKTQMLIRNELNRTGYGFYAVFVCDGDEGNRILRSSEDPTHTQWVSTNCDKSSDATLARRAITELNAFMASMIKENFGGANSSSSDITGAQFYLFMSTAYENNDEHENEVEYGEKTGETTTEETGSPTTTIQNPVKITKQEHRIGIVNVETKTTAAPGEGDLERGKTDQPVDPSPNPPGPHPGPYSQQNYAEDPNGKEGRFMRQIPVTYHFHFLKESDGLYHRVIITSEKEVEDCMLVLTATGDFGKESDDNRVYVVYCDQGNVNKGNIYNVHLNAGKTIIKVKFEDNLRHSLNLKAYENK